MATLTLNGISVLSGTIEMPRVGAWHADLKLDSQTDLSGPATIATDDHTFSLSGTIVRHGLYQGSLGVRVVGGAGGLAKFLPAKAYQNVSLGFIATDILSACGEKLSGTADASITGTFLKSWTRMAGAAVFALQRFFDPYPTSYRVLPDGTFWIGTDTYPANTTVFDLLERDTAANRATLATDRPFLLPGASISVSNGAGLDVRNVSAVTHVIGPTRTLTDAWFEKP